VIKQSAAPETLPVDAGTKIGIHPSNSRGRRKWLSS